MSQKTAHDNTIIPPRSLRLLKTIRRLMGMARQYWWAAWLSAVLIIIGSLLEGVIVPVTLVLPIYAADLSVNLPGSANEVDMLSRIDTFVTQHFHFDAWHAFLFFMALMFISYLLKCLTHGFQTYLSQFFAQRIIFTLRGKLHARLMQLPASFFEARQIGDLMSRTTSDVAMLQGLVSTDLIEAARAPITAIAALALMFKLNFKLTLIALVVAPLVVYAISYSSKKIRKIARETQRRLGQLNAHLQERLSAVRIVQLFTREEYEIQRFDELNERNIQANLRATKVGAMLYPSIEFMAFFGMALALVVAGWLMLKGSFHMAELLVFLIAAQKAGTGFIKIGRVRLAMDQALAAGERVFEVLDTESDIKEDPEPIVLPRLRGEIAFHNVSFRYVTGEEVLTKVDFRIAPGEVIALWGPSGAGKTSLVSLIPRFYDPTQGDIEVDGIDIRRVSLHSLRSQIGIVPQETILFAGSIHENIAYGKLEASRDEVIAAAKAANADEFILSMPQGYDSLVGERGTRLSGGQRQRIAIARAILKDPRILILDEATSSLDIKSESLVQEALSRLMVGRTTIIIAHRPSTIKNANRILVISDGHIIEEGSHEKLIAGGGFYSHMFEGSFPQLPTNTKSEQSKETTTLPAT